MKRKIDYSKKPESEVIVNDVTNRFLRKGMGTTIYVIGLSGTGKSSVSQRLAELITEKSKHEPKTFIVDSLLKFLEALIESKLGDIIIIEEISVLFPSRRAMSSDNLAIAKVLDTCRKKKLCLISNCPIWKSVDSHMRVMGNVLIETLKIIKKEEIVISKALRLQTNPGSGKTYYHCYQRNGQDIKLIYTKMPNKENWDAYEQQKDEFMHNLYQNLKKKQEKKEKKEKNIRPPIRALTEKELQVHQLVNVKKMTHQEVSEIMGVSRSRITNIVKNITKKSQTTKEKGLSNKAN